MGAANLLDLITGRQQVVDTNVQHDGSFFSSMDCLSAPSHFLLDHPSDVDDGPVQPVACEGLKGSQKTFSTAFPGVMRVEFRAVSSPSPTARRRGCILS